MRLPISRRHIPLLATAAVCALLYAAAALRHRDFFALQVFIDLFGDNSFLGIVAVGMTFVILSGGIDLSVGSVVALSSTLSAVLIQKGGLSPLLAIPIVLAVGMLIGLLMGCLIHYTGLPPFIVTLAGMFFARGLAFIIRLESLSIRDLLHRAIAECALDLGTAQVPITAFIFIAVVVIGAYGASWTVFGRNVYALGGNEEAAMLMGVPIARTKLLVYTLSGSCSALAGVVYTLYGSSGDPRAAIGMELDAIAAVVIGGTLLTGGVGYVFGTLLGVLISGIIQTGITFENLNSWWTKVAIGVLLLFFILLQKLLARSALRERA
jgi:simple sugar transport system permease protein